MSAILQEISTQLQKGKMKDVPVLVQKALDEGLAPSQILDEGLMAGMDIIGERFKNNDIFIPEVLIAARAMAAGTDVLRPLLVGDAAQDKGTVVIGTIKDDLHDIGKNLVRMMMESKGLTVIDLGNNVAPAKYIEEAIKHNAQVIACSALLTTTMVHMKEVVSGIASSPLAGKVKLMIGGAPVNEAFRASIGADIYTSDASAAAEKALEICAAARASRFIMAIITPIMIACEVFRPELEYLTKSMSEPPVIIYLEQGLHDTPDELKRLVQNTVDEVERDYNPTEILMAYGFCGRGLHGVTGKTARLIIPRVHDCIPVIRGTGPDTEVRDFEYACTFWASAGWLKYCMIPFFDKREERYQDYLTRFDEDAADYLMELEDSRLNSYTSVCLIKWDGLDTDNVKSGALQFAAQHKLTYKECSGNSGYLQALLDGGTDPELFFHVLPGMFLDINFEGNIILTPVTQTS